MRYRYNLNTKDYQISLILAVCSTMSQEDAFYLLCILSSLALVSSINKICAKMYEPWLKSKHQGNLIFINPTKEEYGRNVLAVKGKDIQNVIAFQYGLCYSSAKLSQSAESFDKADLIAELEVARGMCLKLDTLFVTLNGQILEKMEDLQAFLLHQVRLSNFDPQVLGK